MNDVKWIKLSVNMFNDEKIKLIRTMPEGDKIIVTWVQLLCLAGKTNDGGGIYMGQNIYYTDEMLATLCDQPVNIMRIALKTLQQFGMIEWLDNGLIQITNWEKHQSTDKMSRMKEQTRIRQQKYYYRNKLRELGVNIDVEGFPDDLDSLKELTDETEKPNVRLTLPNGTEVRSKKLEERREKEEVNKEPSSSPKSKTRTYEVDSEPYRLATLLFEKIKSNNPDAKEPNLQKWADDMRKTIELDSRTYDQLQNMIAWSQSNDFWSGVILSAKKLREKYDQMRVQANNEYKKVKTGGFKPSNRKENLPDWATQEPTEKDELVDEDKQKEFEERLARIRAKRKGADE